ncbi:MarR family winged helix-turn-helix transcriptional regulator [Amycolatopsis sp. FDAARGOS 1241]|uniref:MarR family winged helix-turn-helix transcriptional regulator n=1 Tax=Amycolatopsis sp. FDAARGOS 1241 TaxID=2778070 RepID=UPI0019513C44|nr:MarR family winged helix-turn-helix transcriptional regulator [Amycolatopsis sp. FDAARGOS 1241]QRP46107.1 winged helix-turn-helix transcriptional regulator [Amycolatopsis sp. FDAARGOS 1241]
MTDPVADVERAMIAIRRSQQRRALTRMARERGQGAPDPVIELLDVVEELADRGEPATVTSLASALGVDQPRASRLVARAVDQGDLHRCADQADGRRAVLALTDSGRSRLDTLHTFRRTVFAEAMSPWPSEDRAAFARLLTSFVSNYDALGR